MNLSKEEELDRQYQELEFKSTMGCFSIIRFITDFMTDLSPHITHQMTEQNDIPCILVPLIEIKPWLRKNKKGELEKFED